MSNDSIAAALIGTPLRRTRGFGHYFFWRLFVRVEVGSDEVRLEVIFSRRSLMGA
jgi:hypothetical protein